MQSQELYKRFLLKVNKNDSNSGINVLPSHFFLMFSAEVLKWFTQKLDDDSDNVKLDDIYELLEVNKELEFNESFDGYVEFKIPSDFFRIASSYSVVEKGICKDVKIQNFEKKPLGFSATLADEFSKPNFDLGETYFTLGTNNFQVYFDDFKIIKVFSSYYRIPKPASMAGYENIDGTLSVDSTTDLSDANIEEVLDRIATEVIRQYNDGESFELAKDREKS